MKNKSQITCTSIDCPYCLGINTRTTAPTITNKKKVESEEQRFPCPHGRSSWHNCPHCNNQWGHGVKDEEREMTEGEAELARDLDKHFEKLDLIEKAKALLPQYIETAHPKVEHSEECLEREDNGIPEPKAQYYPCTPDCPRKDYDGSRGRATVDIVNYLIYLEKNL